MGWNKALGRLPESIISSAASQQAKSFGAPRNTCLAPTRPSTVRPRRLVELARVDAANPLYGVAVGCVTNVASAILLEPAIADHIVVVWTAGYPTWSPRPNVDSFNLVQDVAAARYLFDCGVPLVYLPGYYIGTPLKLSLPEIERWVRGRGASGDYFHHLYSNNPLYAQRGISDHFGRSWVMWNMINIAWLIEPSCVPTDLVPTPTLDDELHWMPATGAPRHMREAHDVDRDAVFRDFFGKLGKAAR